jgi:hypothetical protein
MDRLDHPVLLGLRMIVHQVAARFITQIQGTGNAVRFKNLFPLPGGFLLKGLFEKRNQ